MFSVGADLSALSSYTNSKIKEKQWVVRQNFFGGLYLAHSG